MEVEPLRLTRLFIANFKSIRRLELIAPAQLMVLIGRNNAGKSNLLDCLAFLSDATKGIQAAAQARGGDLTSILHRKRPQEIVEVALDFALPDGPRAEFIERLFRQNPRLRPSAVMVSPFLRTLHLRVSFGLNGFTDQLSTGNVCPGARPCLLFQVKGDRSGIEQLASPLEMLCQSATDEVAPETVTLPALADNGPLDRLSLGQPPGSERHPVSHLLGGMVREPLAGLQRLEPVRQLASRVRIQGSGDLSQTAANLADVLHSLHNNRPRLFRLIEAEVGKLVPDLGRLYTPTFQGDTTVGTIEGEDEELAFTMDQMSFGTRNAIAIVTKVLLAKPGSWLCIEEPESHLHPEAQWALMSFLREQAATKRIWVATHSTPLAAATPLDSFCLVERDAQSCTVAARLTEREAIRVSAQLGIQPTLDVEAGAAVFVETAAHVPVYEAWSRKTGFALKVQFLDMEEGNTLRYLANARLAASKQVLCVVFAVFGAAAESDGRGRATRQRLIRHLGLTADHLFTLDVQALESYLLDKTAWLKTFPDLPMPEPELEARLLRAQVENDPAQALRELAAELRIAGPPKALATKLAAALPEVPPRIAELFRQVQDEAKPYWSI